MLKLMLRGYVVGLLAISFTCCLGLGRAVTMAQTTPKKNNKSQTPPQQTTPAPQVSLIETPLLFVDPTTSGASTLIRLINKSAQPITNISLSVGSFTSKTSKMDIGAKATFSGPADATTKPTFEIPALAPNATSLVKIDITNLWEAGESEAPLLNNGAEIGKIKAVKYRPAFAVKLVGTAVTGVPDSVELEFEKGNAGQITLKNDDAMTYPVEWELTIGDKTFTGPEPVILPPNSSKAIAVPPPDEWFRSGTGWLKDEVKDGAVTLRLRPTLSTDYPLLPQRSLPIKARLRGVSQSSQTLIAVSFVLVALVAGALCSLVLRDFMPNRLQRIKLEGDLDEIDNGLRDLERLKDSSQTVPVGVERHRLLKNLQAPWFFSTEIATIFAQCREGINTLNRRIAVVEELARAWDLVYEKSQSVSPSLILKARQMIKDAASVLRRTPPRERNLDDPRARLAAARQILESTDANAEFSKELALRATALRETFSDAERSKGTYRKFQEQFQIQFTDLLSILDDSFNYDDPTQIAAANYFDLDMRTSLLLLIAKFQFYSDRPATPEIKEKQLKCWDDFLANLGLRTFEGFRNASIIVDEMQQNIFADSLKETLQEGTPPPGVSIQVEGGGVRANEPVQLSARFTRQPPDLNKTAAREKINCIWEFFHDEGAASSGLKVRGWVIWHYFPEAKKCKTVVSFIDEDTKQLIMKDGKPVTVEEPIDVRAEKPQRSSERFKIELTTFVIALAVALLELVAGAREQLLKLDPTAGFVAVFLIGFSADTIKNLLTQSNRDKPEPPANKPDPPPAAPPAKPAP